MVERNPPILPDQKTPIGWIGPPFIHGSIDGCIWCSDSHKFRFVRSMKLHDTCKCPVWDLLKSETFINACRSNRSDTNLNSDTLH